MESDSQAARLAPDGVATRADLERAILALTDGQLLRLKSYARWRIRALGDRCADQAYEDLLSEAIAAAIEGRRRWYPERVDLVGFLVGAMRSIADNWGKRSHPVQHVDDPGTSFERDDTRRPIAVGGQSPEDEIIERQQREAVLRLFADDPIATLVVCELDEGVLLKEIRTKYGLTDLEYKAALKRIRRKLLRGTDGGDHV